MPYPLDNALYQWEEGYARLSQLSTDPRMAARVNRAVEAVREELRRRIGPPSPPRSSPSSMRAAPIVLLEAATRAGAVDTTDLDPQAITDGAFYLHLRGAATTPVADSFRRSSSLAVDRQRSSGGGTARGSPSEERIRARRMGHRGDRTRPPEAFVNRRRSSTIRSGSIVTSGRCPAQCSA